MGKEPSSLVSETFPEKRFGWTFTVCREQDLQGLGCLNCCCLGRQWKPDQLSLYQFSARPQCSVVKQGFGLSQRHLVWTPGSAGRIFLRDLCVCHRAAVTGWPVPWWMGRVHGRHGAEWFVVDSMASVSAEGAELCGGGRCSCLRGSDCPCGAPVLSRDRRRHRAR